MHSTISGRILKPKRGGKQTKSKNTHRWESFTTKISKLHSLDPLRRVRRHDLDAENLDTTTSYFRNGLEKWADLNISHHYTAFRREVRPFCDSLPQILHFQEKIVVLLEKYISAHEAEALEPLLDLLTAFAHDLGTRFEKYYHRALSLIVGVASRRQNAAVIEWTFACLAFLFKYLSKLIVPDLRPTYDILAPLLGKAKNPPHIARFAAEALSFLVKKVAAPANREKALPQFIEHARLDFEDSRGSRQFGLYYHGLMTMLAEAIKGQGHGVHTTGPEILRALIKSVPTDDVFSLEDITWSNLVCGVLVSIVHHTTSDTFQPVLDAIAEEATNANGNSEAPLRNCIYIRLLGIMTGVRRGTRINDWPLVVKCLLYSLTAVSKNAEALGNVDSSAIWKHLMVPVTIVWQQAPMDAVIPSIKRFLDIITRDPLMKWFIPFCSYFSDLDAVKFRSLFLKEFQKFIRTHWSDASNGDMLCVFLPRMVESRALPSLADPEDFSLPDSWQMQIEYEIELLEKSPFPEKGASSACNKDPKTWLNRCLPKYSALLHLIQSVTVRPSMKASVADRLLTKLKLALRPSQSLDTDNARFIVSQGFSAYLSLSKETGQVDKSLAPLLRAASPRYQRLTGFLESMVGYHKRLKDHGSPTSQSDSSTSSDREEDPLLKILIENLATPSHEHRLASLKLLDELDNAPDQLDCLAIMMQIEQTPLDLQNVRVFSVHIRKLAANYAELALESWLRRAIPSYLYGLMTVRMTPVWESVLEALQVVSQVKTAEDIVCDMAFKWIDVPSKRWEAPLHDATPSSKPGLTDFECRNLASLERQAIGSQEAANGPSEIMLQVFEENQQLAPPTPVNARSQAIKVFSAIPSLAEKRSRRLIPYFLSWAMNIDEQETPEQLSEPPSNDSWSLFDKKSLLGVIAQFINPKVLYQSQQVYDSLLGLLTNGDIEIQKSALKAVLAWKQEGVVPYQENLEYLLDEARFKNELTVLFQGDNQIQPGHRSEVMPVVLHLLYGRSISKKGISSGRHGLHATRLAVLRQLTVEDMGSFLDIALGDLRDVQVVEDAKVREAAFENEVIPPRKQVGLSNMMEAMINELGTSVIEYAPRILNAVLYCLVSSSRRLNQSPDDEQEEPPAQTSLIRVVRTTSLKCVIALLKNAPTLDWSPYKDIIIKEAVSPRLEKFAVENTQGVSGTLQLLSTFSLFPRTALFLAVDDRIIPKLMESMAFEKTKTEVRIAVLEIIRNLVRLSQQPAHESEYNELIREELLDPNVNLLLATIAQVLKSQSEISRDLLLICVEALVDLAPIIQRSEHVSDLIDVSTFLLNQPARYVNPKVKSLILSMLQKLLHLEGSNIDPELKDRVYSTVSSLFGFFKDRASREALSSVLTTLSSITPISSDVAQLCSDLNSYKSNRIEEPDYDRRLAAFNVLIKSSDRKFVAREWEPLVHNLIFYIKHDEEFGILSANSADCLCKFVDAASTAEDNEQESFYQILSQTLIEAFYINAKEHSETVRRETVRVLGHLVSRMPSWPPVSDLATLNTIADGKDSDSNFFSNILSPAAASQIRALQLLSKVNFHSPMHSRHLTHFFIPLLEHFIFGREDGSDDHGVGAQAATTISDLAVSLEWPQYRATLRRYIGYVDSKPDAQKQLIRFLGKFIDALSAAASQKNQSIMEIDGGLVAQAPTKHRLAVTLPAEEKFAEDILSNILPRLLDYIHEKDEATVSSRVPVGIIIVKVMKLLPTGSLELKLPGVLTDICHILRSKALESREMARDTLAKMTSLLGPPYFGFVLNELRGALISGYQLHVLSYTMHAILIAVVPQFQPGDLDYCLRDIVNVIMDDIFGVTGQEKDAEEYTNKMKEIKSSKSQDSMELVARTSSINHLVDLIRPLQSLLLEKLDLRMVRKIEALLSRITNGLLNNPAAESRDTLVLCYEVIQRVYASRKPHAEQRLDPKLRRYLIQKGAKKSGDRSTTSKYTHKLICFALDVLRAVFKKHDSLRNANNITGFIPILGDAIVGGEEEVQISAFKLLTILVKVPFKTDDSTKLYKVAAKEATKSISTSQSTTTDLAQTALKLMSVVIRDRRDIPVKDAAIDMLLGKVKDDLTEPLHRHVTFSFLRSILDRRVEAASVYDTLDYVGTVMVTNDDKDTRDLARGAFFQFLRDYPQKRNRWAKQLSFVVANLKYDREGGRLSAMEVIHRLLTNSADDFVQEVATTCFIPLIFILANDDSEKCRLAAGELIKQLFQKADKERTSKFLALARNWLDQQDNSSVLRLAIQAFSLYFEARDPAPKDRQDLNLVLEAIADILDNYATFFKDAELMTTILQAVPILIQKHEAIALAHERLWHSIPRPLSHPDFTVKVAAVRLLNAYLDFSERKESGQAKIGSYGLELDLGMTEQLITYAVGILHPAVISRWVRKTQKRTKNSTTTIKDIETPKADAIPVDEALAAEVIPVIVKLSKFLDAGSSGNDASEDDASEDDDEKEEEEEEWGGIDEEDKTSNVTLHTLFIWLSDIIMEETRPNAASLVPKVAALDIISVLIATQPTAALEPSLNAALTPLHRLTDPAIPIPFSHDDTFKARHEGLRTKAGAAMDALQRRLGTAAYSRELLAVRDHSRRRREGRSRKRKIEAVTQPERFGKWKKSKMEKKVKRRKEKGLMNRKRRHEY
ncbi:armadillo-type protein [Xylariomycetidae sp. FL2044]|nr:armadillo-type protein [Xylariomycetidae sp. FL2044]